MDIPAAFEDIYAQVSAGGLAERVLNAQNFYFSLAKGTSADRVLSGSSLAPAETHDDRTAEPQPVPLENVCRSLADLLCAHPRKRRDRFTHAVEFSLRDLQHLLRDPRESIIREEVPLPLHKVHTLTPNGVIYINRQPGETRRQKLLSCRSGIPAVNRRFSLNTLENRVLKRYVQQIEALCAKRAESAGDSVADWEPPLADSVTRWLRQDEVQEILPRGPELPNNVITGNVHYNRVWRSLGLLNDLDASLGQDAAGIAQTESNHAFWRMVAYKKYKDGAKFPQMPVFFDDCSLVAYPGNAGRNTVTGRDAHGEFSLSWDSTGVLLRRPGQEEQKISISQVRELDLAGISVAAEQRPAGGEPLLDFCAATPWFADDAGLHDLPFTPRLLRWHGSEDDLLLDLGSADGLELRAGDSVMDALSLFNDPGDDAPEGAKAAQAEFPRLLAARLHRWLGDDAPVFTYLVPDEADDFLLANLRSAIQLEFSGGKHIHSLPRSVASVLGKAQEPDSELQNGSLVVALSVSHRFITLTPLVAEKQRIPECAGYCPRGLVWVRHPALLMHRFVSAEEPRPGLHFLPHSRQGVEGLSLPLEPTQQEEKAILGKIARLQEELAAPTVDLLADSPARQARGAAVFSRFEAMTAGKGSAVIWKDHLPTLVLRYTDEHMADARFTLVSADTTVSPRSRSVEIPIAETFTLPAGQRFYVFTILLGQDEKNYAMRLDCPVFPLKRDTKCRLKLQYTYGAPHPYELRFHPDTPDPRWAASAEWLTSVPSPKLQAPPAAEVSTEYTHAKGYTVDYNKRAPEILQRINSVTEGEVISSELGSCCVRDLETGEEFSAKSSAAYAPGTRVLYIFQGRRATNVIPYREEEGEKARLTGISPGADNQPTRYYLEDLCSQTQYVTSYDIPGAYVGMEVEFKADDIAAIHASALLKDWVAGTVKHVNYSKNLYIIQRHDTDEKYMVFGRGELPDEYDDILFNPKAAKHDSGKMPTLRSSCVVRLDETDSMCISRVDTATGEIELSAIGGALVYKTKLKKARHLEPGTVVAIKSNPPIILNARNFKWDKDWPRGKVISVDPANNSYQFKADDTGLVYSHFVKDLLPSIGDEVCFDASASAIHAKLCSYRRSQGAPPACLAVAGEGAPISRGNFVAAIFAVNALINKSKQEGRDLAPAVKSGLATLPGLLKKAVLRMRDSSDYFAHSLAGLCLTAFSDNPPKEALDLLASAMERVKSIALRDMDEEKKKYVLRGFFGVYTLCTGSLDHSWQKALFDLITQMPMGRFFIANRLSTALWQNPQAVLNLTMHTINQLLKICKAEPSEDSLVGTCTHQAEIMLALLRLRDSADPAIRSFFGVNGKGNSVILKVLNERIRLLTECGRYDQISSSLLLNLDEDTQGAPAIFYVLRLYLTGEKPLAGIRITSSVNSDDDDD